MTRAVGAGVALAALALSSGCYLRHGAAPRELDAGSPVGPQDAGPMDAGRDAGPADAELEPDGGDSDAGRDAGPVDAGHDAGRDAGPDAQLPPDAGRDGGTDGGTDAGCPPDGGLLFSEHTIDRSELSGARTYDATARGLMIYWAAGQHFMSDGSEWATGGGGRVYSYVQLERVERVGTSLRYYFTPLRVSRSDYDGGEHYADHAIESFSEVVLVAEEGSTIATMEGQVQVTRDEPWTGCITGLFYRYHHLSAPVGALVPFRATLTLAAPAAFTETVFDEPFDFRWDVVIDFAEGAP